MSVPWLFAKSTLYDLFIFGGSPFGIHFPPLGIYPLMSADRGQPSHAVGVVAKLQVFSLAFGNSRDKQHRHTELRLHEPEMSAGRWLPFKGPLPVSSPRPLEWLESEDNPFNPTIVLDVLQQLLSGDPVGIQNTYITVLSSNRSVRLGNLGELRLRIQGIPHQNLVRTSGDPAATYVFVTDHCTLEYGLCCRRLTCLHVTWQACMVLNAPLGPLERIWRSLAAKIVYTMHFVAVWAGFVALRDAYVLERKPGMLTDLAGSVLYYFTASIMGVSAAPTCSAQRKYEDAAHLPSEVLKCCLLVPTDRHAVH